MKKMNKTGEKKTQSETFSLKKKTNFVRNYSERQERGKYLFFLPQKHLQNFIEIGFS